MNVDGLSLDSLRKLKNSIEQEMNLYKAEVHLPIVGLVSIWKLPELLKMVKDRIAALENPPGPRPGRKPVKNGGRER